jgi:CheY-like chemotaxis protein
MQPGERLLEPIAAEMEFGLARILVVDDNAHYRKALASALASVGYEVEEAETARHVTDRVCGGGFDLVITDIVMPEFDGLELILAMKRSCPEIPVIAVSGVPHQESYLRSARSLGAAAAVSKEYPTEALVHTVQRILAS